MAFGWIAPTSGLGGQVRKAKSSCSPRTLARSPVQGRDRPAKNRSGRSASAANRTDVLRCVVSSYSQKEVKGTTQRNSGLSQGRQKGDATLRMFVTCRAWAFGGGGKPQRKSASCRPPREIPHHGRLVVWEDRGPRRQPPDPPVDGCVRDTSAAGSFPQHSHAGLKQMMVLLKMPILSIVFVL